MYGSSVIYYLAGLLIARMITNLEKKYRIENMALWMICWTVAFLVMGMLSWAGGNAIGFILLIAFYTTVLDWGEHIIDLETAKEKALLWTLIPLTFIVLCAKFIIFVVAFIVADPPKGLFTLAFMSILLFITYLIRKPLYERVDDFFRWKW